MMETKIKNITQLKKIIVRLKNQGKKIVFTNGCFDILHFGHAKYLKEAKRKGDILIVGVNSDSSVRKIKGNRRPIINEAYRAGLIAALESVDFVVIFKEETPFRVIKTLKPDILVKGADWAQRDIVGRDFILKGGGKVYTVKLVKGLSTTDLTRKLQRHFKINRIIDANINRAKEGLRVCEEITRFILNNRKLTSDFKTIRHQIDDIIKYLPVSLPDLLKTRESREDVGRNIYLGELKRKNLSDIFSANIQRVKESIRVLEEFSKLINIKFAIKFKRIRYNIYEIEKKATGKILSLSNRR